jgi:two-component system, NtrC family, response regulator
MEKLLVVDDTEEILKQLRWGLGRTYKVITAGTVDEALGQFQTHQPRVVTLDLGLPPHANGTREGFRCLEALLRIQPATKIIVLTGHGQRETALKAVSLGAYDYYCKPIDLSELKIILARVFHVTGLEEENRRLQTVVENKPHMHGIFGQCPAMGKIFQTIRKVASCDVPVLIQGESGTGKEMVARAIHERGLRSSGPFIPINCGAIPENLLESELFGHEKGAFTGAMVRVQGKVEYAHRGTLFLDEIGELSPALQVKLLRFLQEKVIQRVGGREDINIDARIITATNADIQKSIEADTFREDLYYRIGVLTINLPPLRERGEDVPLLANLFLRRFSEELGKKFRGFSAGAMDRMSSFNWPGNVREMENRIKRAVIMSDSTVIDAADLGLDARPQKNRNAGLEKLRLKEARDKLESDLIIQAIQQQAGNIARAAESLGISRPTLYDLMKKHGYHHVS